MTLPQCSKAMITTGPCFKNNLTTYHNHISYLLAFWLHLQFVVRYIMKQGPELHTCSTREMRRRVCSAVNMKGFTYRSLTALKWHNVQIQSHATQTNNADAVVNTPSRTKYHYSTFLPCGSIFNKTKSLFTLFINNNKPLLFIMGILV